jgi:hypothetical protein
MGTRLKSSRRQIFLGFTVFLLIVAAVGCASGGSTPAAPTAKAEISPPPTVEKIEPTVTTVLADPESQVATPTEVPSPVVEPTSAPAPTAAPAATSTPVPTATPEPTATPVPLTNVYDNYGFTVELDQDATFATSNLNIDGWSGTTADSSQGLMTFNYNGADIVLFWQPQADSTPQETIDLTYQLQQLGNPDLLFASLSDGDITVAGSAGRFTGFLSTDSLGGNATGGLIGAWTCADSGTQLSMTATGPDSTALQIRFDRIISGFSCDAK